MPNKLFIMAQDISDDCLIFHLRKNATFRQETKNMSTYVSNRKKVCLKRLLAKHS